MDSLPANHENYLIPPYPPLEKGGWGDLRLFSM
jgi:hypothetical protein